MIWYVLSIAFGYVLGWFLNDLKDHLKLQKSEDERIKNTFLNQQITSIVEDRLQSRETYVMSRVEELAGLLGYINTNFKKINGVNIYTQPYFIKKSKNKFASLS